MEFLVQPPTSCPEIYKGGLESGPVVVGNMHITNIQVWGKFWHEKGS